LEKELTTYAKTPEVKRSNDVSFVDRTVTRYIRTKDDAAVVSTIRRAVRSSRKASSRSERVVEAEDDHVDDDHEDDDHEDDNDEEVRYVRTTKSTKRIKKAKKAKKVKKAKKTSFFSRDRSSSLRIGGHGRSVVYVPSLLNTLNTIEHTSVFSTGSEARAIDSGSSRLAIEGFNDYDVDGVSHARLLRRVKKVYKLLKKQNRLLADCKKRDVVASAAALHAESAAIAAAASKIESLSAASEQSSAATSVFSTHKEEVSESSESSHHEDEQVFASASSSSSSSESSESSSSSSSSAESSESSSSSSESSFSF